MKQMTSRLGLSFLFLIPALCFAQTPDEREIARTQISVFHNCVTIQFRKAAAREPDKELVFDKAFKSCQKEENAIVNVLRGPSPSIEEAERLKISLRNDLKTKLITDLSEHIDDLLRRVAYISELGTCDDADERAILMLREGLIGEIYDLDNEQRLKKSVSLQTEYYRILIRVNISGIGLQRWCQEQRAFLQKGYAQKQTELKLFKE